MTRANKAVLDADAVMGPASAVNERVAVYDGTSGKLLKDGGKTIAELVPAGYDDLLITVSLLALQVADNTNVALFLGDAGNRVADSFDALTYVDVAGATNLNTSVAGVLKPTITPVDFQFLGATSDGTDTATYTFAGQNFGAASADRFIAVAVETRANSARTITSVTIGGVAASVAVSGNNAASGAELAAIYIANVPTGTSGSIVVTCSGAMVRCAIGVYRMSNLNSSLPVDTDGSTGNTTSGSVTLDVVNGGPVIGVIKQAQTSTWTYLNEDYDQVAPDTGGDYFSFASKLADETKVGQVITNTFGASAVFAMVAAAWAPQAGDVDNLTVRSAAFTAAVAPTSVMALIRVKEIDAAVAGTDYTLEVSRNNGGNWTALPLQELFTSPSPTSNIRVVGTAETDISGQPTGTQVRWRFKTLTNKIIELHDVYLYWN